MTIKNRKANNKKEKIKKVFKRAMLIVTYILALFLAQTTQVFATNDPLAVINNLSSFIFDVIRAVGLITLGYGVMQVGMSLKSHDPSQRASGIMTLAGGVIMTFTKEILNLIIGG